MRKQVRFWSVLVLVALVSSYAAAAQKPALQQADTSAQLVVSGPDVITASDAGGGALSSRDLLLITAIGVVVLVIALVL